MYVLQAFKTGTPPTFVISTDDHLKTCVKRTVKPPTEDVVKRKRTRF
jgi:hypothetical protein